MSSSKIVVIVCGVICGLSASIRGQSTVPTTQTTKNAANLYLRAFQLIPAVSPAASNFEFPGYPPFGADWDRLAEDAWNRDSAARDLAHQARSINTVKWPEKLSYLNDCRNLANTLGDAALYEHFHDDDAGAASTIQDLLHLSKLLRANHPPTLIQYLVASGIDALTSYRVMVISAGVKLTDETSDTKKLKHSAARLLIRELTDQENSEDQFHQFLSSEFQKMEKVNADRVMETFRRTSAERIFGAMSLACHLYLFDKHRWPESLDELVPNYLATVPIDPWGDGKQTFGYAVIAAGLPDGSDRPMLYSRCGLRGKPYYRIDQPIYGFTPVSNQEGPAGAQKHGGQFRDIASWVPGPGTANVPTTQPLE